MRSTSDIAVARLNHVSGHIHGEYPETRTRLAIQNLLTGQGSEQGSLMGLESRSRGKAIYAWFAENDLALCKDWFATTAVLKKKRLSLLDPVDWRGATTTFDVLEVACTDDTSARRALGAVTEKLHDSVESDPLAFLSQQIGLILRGEIQASAEATEKFARTHRPVGSELFFAPDIDVFRAIHFGSDSQVEETLTKVCDISLEGRRKELEGGFTEGLLSVPATVYLRLCWAVGRRIQVDHELIPMEWMPATELKHGYFRFPELLPYIEAEGRGGRPV
jgi:hypothetical protein